MAYAWNKELETGHDLIDSQHKELIARFSNLLESCSSGRGKTDVIDTMDFLIQYTVKHFNDEESLMRQYQYPEYDAHKKLHENFKLTVGELANQLKEEGPKLSLVTNLNLNIGSWLRNHIRKEDAKLAAFIRAGK